MTGPTNKPAATAGMPLAVVWRRIEQLQSDPKNLRSYSCEQIRQLAKSIALFGFNVPIVISPELRIIAGYSWLLAARELGWSEVPTILLEDLSAAQARAFMTADKRLAEAASWNDLLLAMQLKELSITELKLGKPQRHSPDHARRATGTCTPVRLCRSAPPTPGDTAGEGAASPLPAWAPVVRDGDWWLLGNHRVHCGTAGNVVAEMLTREDGVVVVFAPDPAAADEIISRWPALTGGNARRAAKGRDSFSVDLRGADALAGN